MIRFPRLLTRVSRIPSLIRSHSFTPKEAQLQNVVKLPLLLQLNDTEIHKLWNSYFSSLDSISATVKPSLYQQIQSYAAKYPFFILPLFKNKGHEFFFIQFKNNQIFITSLAQYQLHQESAQPLFVITFYPELFLEHNKSIVLMMGKHASDQKNYITIPEAQNLATQIQLFYALCPRHMALVEKFHTKPTEFSYQELLYTVQEA